MKLPSRTTENSVITAGALAASGASAVALKIDSTRLQGTIPAQVDWQFSFTGKTAAEGPILVGLAAGLDTGDLTAWFTSDPQRIKDPEEAEESQRPVLPLAVIPAAATASAALALSGDLAIRNARWPGWHIRESVSMVAFLLNMDTEAITSGLVVSLYTNIRGDWIND